MTHISKDIMSTKLEQTKLEQTKLQSVLDEKLKQLPCDQIVKNYLIQSRKNERGEKIDLNHYHENRLYANLNKSDKDVCEIVSGFANSENGSCNIQ
jgi:hypothetical protein